jgi:hypothetical protein
VNSPSIHTIKPQGKRPNGRIRKFYVSYGSRIREKSETHFRVRS